MTPRKIGCLGMLLLILIAGIGVIAIIFGGVSSTMGSTMTTTAPLSTIGTAQIVSMIYVFVTLALGIFAFCCKNKCVVVVVTTFIICSFLFCCLFRFSSVASLPLSAWL